MSTNTKKSEFVRVLESDGNVVTIITTKTEQVYYRWAYFNYDNQTRWEELQPMVADVEDETINEGQTRLY
jgi:hypothetical protein